MKRLTIVCLSLVFVIPSGCSKKPSTASAANVQQEFKSTRSDVREFADQAVAAEDRQDYNTAFIHYRALSLNPELTPEQRNAANDAMIKMNQKLRERATNGDTDAQKVLDYYRATK